MVEGQLGLHPAGVGQPRHRDTNQGHDSGRIQLGLEETDGRWLEREPGIFERADWDEGSRTLSLSIRAGDATTTFGLHWLSAPEWLRILGEADFEVTDAQNRIKVPPEEPAYELRRVALSKEEEDGYYYGFSNEALWPLCHIVYTKPVFNESDWEVPKILAIDSFARIH